MFNLIKIENGRINVPEPEFIEAAANIAVNCGEALVLSSGKLTKCGATTAPAYIAMGDLSEGSDKRRVPVCRIEKNQVYEVPCSAAPASLKVGDKVTLGDDALSVTATTASGVVTVVSLNGAKAAGDKLIVRI